MPGAPVKYRIERDPLLPWFWWGYRPPSGGKNEVASGTLKTDGTGKFSLTFTPEAAPDEYDWWPEDREALPTRYTVHIEARDAGGRTITSVRSLAAGEKAYLVDVQLTSGFIRAEQKGQVDVRLVNLNEQPVAGKAEYEVFEIKDPPKEPADANDPSVFNDWNRAPSLEELFQKAANGAKRSSGRFEIGSARPTRIDLTGLPQGIFRIVVSANDPWGGKVSQSRILLVVDPKSQPINLPLPYVSIPEFTSYLAGETAQVLVGSKEL